MLINLSITFFWKVDNVEGTVIVYSKLSTWDTIVQCSTNFTVIEIKPKINKYCIEVIGENLHRTRISSGSILCVDHATCPCPTMIQNFE